MPTARFPLDDHEVWGFECPRAFIPVQVQTPGRLVPVSFLLDTGAAVSLIPIPFASVTGIPFDPISELDESDAPRTLLGRLTGHKGSVTVRLLDRLVSIPCAFYHPSNPSPGIGSPGGRSLQHAPRTLDEWAAASKRPTVRIPRSSIVLGRLGFLNRFRVTIDSRDGFRYVEVSDER
jgi:hypothetical protein